MKSYLKFLTALFVFYFTPITSTFSQQTLTKTIANRFAKLWYFNPQEKIYLHTDKPYYNAGEDIWFKAYLLNAATHRPESKSGFVYVELIDKTDSVITRVKIRKDSLGFSGNIKLLPEIQPGMYSLRSYSSWMQNTPDFFFHKQIQIGNSIDDRVNCKVTFNKLKDGRLQTELVFTNAYQASWSGKNIAITQSWVNGIKRKINTITSVDGKVILNLAIDSSYQEKKYLEVSLKEPGLKYLNKVLIPELETDFDIKFFPESGVFLDDNIQNVGFKAIGTNGLGVDVEGRIFNNNNEELLEFKSINQGMGKIFIKTNPGESYYAIAKTADGKEKRVNLPATQPTGIALQVVYNRNKINYQIANKTNVPSDSLYLMIHSRGVVYLVMPLKQEQGQIPENILPAGVSSFSIIDSIGNIWCERVYFNRNFVQPEILFKTDKANYPKRSLVNLEFNIHDLQNKAINGSYSLSVTDSKLIIRDSLDMNIQNYLLLSSDLKGYIEQPGIYFTDNSATTREKTDVLMLTQGWKRFSTGDILKQKYPVNNFYMEAGQTVSGKVLTAFGKPAKDRDVIMLASYKNRISVTKTDSAGLFLIDGIEIPDSTQIVLKARSKSKIIDVVIEADKDIFPKAISYFPTFNSSTTLPPDYFMLSKEKYYNDGGMVVINLDEFNVDAKAKPKNAQDAMYASLADNSITSEKLEEYAGLQLLDIISMVPGVQVNGQDISIRGSNGNPLFVIDGIETDRIDDVLYLNTSDIDAIHVFKGVSTTMFGSKGGNGVIAISLKKGVQLQSLPPSSLARIMPLGFQKPSEFYVPKYDVDSVMKKTKTDYRNTIYWNPTLTADANGCVKASFYTADKTNDYHVELEGVGPKGEICRFKGIIRRKD